MPHRHREQAKRVILELIRQNGGRFRGKMRLYKAFWQAHLAFAEAGNGYLSAWPVVRMPKGPAIDNADSLLEELEQEDLIEIGSAPVGRYKAKQYSLTPLGDEADPPTPAEREAILTGLGFVSGKTGADVSHESHTSRAWKAVDDGQEMNIYLDLLTPSEEREEREAVAVLFEQGRDLLSG